MLDKYLNKITCADSYKAIKEIPDKSIDCIYTDIPYLYEAGGVEIAILRKRLKKTQHS